MVHTASDVVTVDAPEIHHTSVPIVTHPPMPTPPRRDLTGCHDEVVKVNPLPQPLIAVADDTATVQSMRPAQQHGAGRSGRPSKGRQRKRRRLHKEKEPTLPDQLANDTDKRHPADAITSCHEQPQVSIHGPSINVPDSHPKLRQVSGHTDGEATIQVDSGIDLPRENSHRNANSIPEEASVPALRLKAGFRTQRVRHLIARLLSVNLVFRM